MTTSCKNCALRRQKLFSPMSSEEVSFMERFKVGELAVAADTQILMEGANSPQLFTVYSGMGLRYKMLENGERQVLNFVYPGDFLGLQSGVMGQMRHSVEATTDMKLCVFSRSDVWSMFKSTPERAFDMTWLSAMDESLLGEALTSVGQMTAPKRMAWALTRVYQRGQALGLVRPGGGMPFPYRQQDLADALGLSLVHTNKTLSNLRTRQLAHWSDGQLRIPNLEALAEEAEVELSSPNVRPLL